MTEVDKAALKKLREPFPAEQIGKLPKGGMFLDFVGHGFLTARFLDVDPEWSWEPFALDANGLPLIDVNGGLWIRLTICGVTRIGYGDGKGVNAVKEAIGDALRNAGMRFGAALDLWCKGDPDAVHNDPPPPQRTDLSDALDELDDACIALKLVPGKVASQFYDKQKKTPRQATAKVIREFIHELHEEAEKAKKAANG